MNAGAATRPHRKHRLTDGHAQDRRIDLAR